MYMKGKSWTASTLHTHTTVCVEKPDLAPVMPALIYQLVQKRMYMGVAARKL